MNIDIVSNDQRYVELNSLLNKAGYSSQIKAPKEVNSPDILVLSVRDELSENELEELFKKVPQKTLVFSGNHERIKRYFSGEIIDYSKNEELLEKNALLTAEATVSVFHSLTKRTARGQKIFICGYGRIGRELARIFSALGSEIFVFARRTEVKNRVEKDGYSSVLLDYASECDVIINTAPSVVFDSSLIAQIPKEATIIELASVCGFENRERVNFALGLPGKIMPKSSARVIYDTIVPLFK